MQFELHLLPWNNPKKGAALPFRLPTPGRAHPPPYPIPLPSPYGGSHSSTLTWNPYYPLRTNLIFTSFSPPTEPCFPSAENCCVTAPPFGRLPSLFTPLKAMVPHTVYWIIWRIVSALPINAPRQISGVFSASGIWTGLNYLVPTPRMKLSSAESPTIFPLPGKKTGRVPRWGQESIWSGENVSNGPIYPWHKRMTEDFAAACGIR